MTEHMSSFDLDAAALDGASAAQRAHLASCAACRARADEDHGFRAELSPEVMERTLAVWRRRRRVAVVRWAVPLVMAAAAFVLLVRPGETPEVVEPDLAVKGTRPGLAIYALRDGHVFQVGDGDVLAPGDEIRFAVTPAGSRYVLIGSIDGFGRATIYVPYEGERSVAIDPRGRTELPGSIVLDDAPGPERVFAVFSSVAIRAADVRQALHRFAALRGSTRLELGMPATQVSLVFQKAAR
jgi:hypothetical protein